jgi:hypothetical protein
VVHGPNAGSPGGSGGGAGHATVSDPDFALLEVQEILLQASPPARKLMDLDSGGSFFKIRCTCSCTCWWVS